MGLDLHADCRVRSRSLPSARHIYPVGKSLSLADDGRSNSLLDGSEELLVRRRWLGYALCMVDHALGAGIAGRWSVRRQSPKLALGAQATARSRLKVGRLKRTMV